MSQPTLDVFQEAMQVLDGYYRAVVTKVAEDIIENRDNFDVSYTGRAEEIIDRYGMHLQSLARIYMDLMTLANSPDDEASLAQEASVASGMPAAQPASGGRPIEADTALEVGTPVLAEWRGAWWQASVLSLESDGTVRIHYASWDDHWDETVPRSRLREDAS